MPRPQSVSQAHIRNNPPNEMSNSTHNNNWKEQRRAGQKSESWISLQAKQQAEENRVVEAAFQWRMEKGYPRQEVPERIEPFPERAPDSNIFEKGFLSLETVKRLASWKGLKTAFYWSVKGLQAFHDVKSNFTPNTLSGRDISPLNPTVHDQYVKIPTAETKGQPDSHAGSQLEPKKAPTWERSLESQKPLNGTSPDIPSKIQAPQTKQEQPVKKKWNLPLCDTVDGLPRREWSDYVDEDELELRQRHQNLIIDQQNAVAREATEEFQAQQFNTTAPTTSLEIS